MRGHTALGAVFRLYPAVLWDVEVGVVVMRSSHVVVLHHLVMGHFVLHDGVLWLAKAKKLVVKLMDGLFVFTTTV